MAKVDYVNLLSGSEFSDEILYVLSILNYLSVEDYIGCTVYIV